MSHSYAALFYHVVFSTAERRPLIVPAKSRELYVYLAGIARNLKIDLLKAGGTANHVHLVVCIPATMPVCSAVQKLKANASRFLGPRFAWQEGYGIFSVSASQLSIVKRYISNQEEHHRKRSFEEEYVVLLEKSGVTFDSRALFYNRVASPEGDSEGAWRGCQLSQH